MDLKKEYGTDKEKEVEGIWEDFANGIKLKIARWNNPGFRDMFSNEIAKSPRKYRGKKSSDKVMKDLQIKCAATHVLKDWKNVDYDGEKNVPYSIEMGIKVFTDLPDFYDEVVGVANDFENYREKDIEEDLGN